MEVKNFFVVPSGSRVIHKCFFSQKCSCDDRFLENNNNNITHGNVNNVIERERENNKK